MRSIAERIRQGCSLTEAFEMQGNYFPPNFHRLVEVGEKSGRLERVFNRMARHYAELAGLKATFLRSILWPLTQLAMAAVVVSLLIYIPTLLSQDRDTAVDLLGFGLVGGRGLAIFWCGIAAVVASITASWMLARNRHLAFVADWIMRVPLVRRSLLTFDEANFVQSLATAIESGVSAANAVTLAFRGCSSIAFQSKADAARESILHGRALHSMLRDTRLFSRDTIEAVELGEASGRTAETLDKHFVVLRMRVEFAMTALTRLVSSVVWIAVTGLLALLIFRLFGRYVSQINDAATAAAFIPVSRGRHRP